MTSMPSLLFTIGFGHTTDKNSPQSKGRGRQGQTRRAAGGAQRATAEADTRRDRRERSIQFAKYCEIIDSHNFASYYCRKIMRMYHSS